MFRSLRLFPLRHRLFRWRPLSRAVPFALAVGLAACTREPSPAEREAAKQAEHVREVVAAGGVVDSILPVGEALQRFRAAIPRVDTLSGASRSKEALVERLAKDLAARDSADLSAMIMTQAEFAWLFYEESPLSKPPYEAPPGLLYGQLLTASDKGARDLLARLGGSAVRVSGLDCPAPEIEGRNRLYKRCTVTFAAPGKKPLSGNLFGTILERDGRFKLLSYANRI